MGGEGEVGYVMFEGETFGSIELKAKLGRLRLDLA